MNTFFKKLLYGGGIIFDLCKWIILAVVILSLIQAFWFSFFIVDGASMDPTLTSGELVLLRKNYYEQHDPVRGDIVAVRYPGDPENKKYVKRVIGLPGEAVIVSGGRVFIGGQLLKEEYIRYDVATEPDGSWVLNSNEYFLMGDNRPMSNDSRYFGPVEKRFFMGKASSVIYPRIVTKL